MMQPNFVQSISKILQWLRSLFTAKKPVVQPCEVLPTQAESPIEKPEPRQRKKPRPNVQTLASLLDGLDESFRTMSIPAIKGAWMTKREIAALYKLGVYVNPGWQLERISALENFDQADLPTIASAYLFNKAMDNERYVHPRFMFAMKQPRLPTGVENIRGIPYRFGACYEIKEGDSSRMFWMWAWVSVDPKGEVHLLHEIRNIPGQIVHRRSCAGRSRVSSVNNKLRVIPALVTDLDGATDTNAELMRNFFCSLMLWWQSRKDRWSVGVKKDGHRVTFSISQDDTVSFFADRGKQVTVDGKTRPIIHYVNEHTRVNGSVVKAHVRGLSNFEWKGYSCSVTAPKMRGRVFTNFPMPPIELPRGEKSTNYIELDDLAEKLAKHEDENRQPATA